MARATKIFDQYGRGEQYTYSVNAGQERGEVLSQNWNPPRVSFINLSSPGGPTVRLEQYG